MTILSVLDRRIMDNSFRTNVKHEARLTGSVVPIQEQGLKCGESFGLGACQPLLSMRLFCFLVCGSRSAHWYTRM